MNMQAFKLQNLFLATAMIAMASCSDSVIEGIEPEANPLDDYVTDVKLNVEDFEYVGDGTRTSYDLNWETYEGYTTFSWTKGDKVGVMPIKEYGDPWPSTMVAYTIESKDDAKGAEATFDGRGWQLKNNVKYTALYPYSYTFNDPETMDYEFFQVSFQGQRQIGNNSRSHLGKYDFMAAAPVQSENGSLHFNFKHLATLCQFDIYAQEKRTFSKMVVSFTDGTTIYKIPLDAAIVDYQTTSPYLYTFNSQPAFEIALQDVTTGSDGYVHIFAMLPPEMFEKDIYISKIDVKLIDTYGYEIAFSTPYKKVSPAAGRYLKLTFNEPVSGYEKTRAKIADDYKNILSYKVNREIVRNVFFESDEILDESYDIDLSAPNETHKVKAKYDPYTESLYFATDASQISIKDCSSMFKDYTLLQSVYNLGVLDTKQTTTMASMFNGCRLLSNVSFDGIDTRSVRDFSYMFYGCANLEEIDLDDFMNNSATDFSYMFAGCTYLKNFILGNLVRSNSERKPVSLRGMFMNCKKVNSIIGYFDTSCVTDMAYMFSGFKLENDSYYSYVRNLFENFDTSMVTDMSYMFAECNLKWLYLRTWRTDHLQNVEAMFENSNLADLFMEEATFEHVTNFNRMLKNTRNVYILDFQSMIFDTSKATYQDMMYKCGDEDWSLPKGDVKINANLYMKDFFTKREYTDITKLDSRIKFNWYL